MFYFHFPFLVSGWRSGDCDRDEFEDILTVLFQENRCFFNFLVKSSTLYKSCLISAWGLLVFSFIDSAHPDFSFFFNTRFSWSYILDAHTNHSVIFLWLVPNDRDRILIAKRLGVYFTKEFINYSRFFSPFSCSF